MRIAVAGLAFHDVLNQFQQMTVLHLLDAVGKHYKPAIDLIEFAALKLVSQLFAAQSQSVAAGVLAQHEPRVRCSHRLWRHDFVGQWILEHAVLVNAGLVRKCIAPGDGLVGLHRNARNLRQHLAGSIKMFAGDCGLVGIAVRTHPHGHDDLFQRRIAGALPNSIDRALHLARTLLYSRERVRDRQTEVVVAVGRDRYFVDTGDLLAQRADEGAVFFRHAVPDRIGNVNSGSASRDDCFDHLAEKRDIGTGGVFGREFNVGAERLGVPNRFLRLLQALLACNAKLVLQMNVRSCQKNMDARVRRSLQCLPGAVHVADTSTSQARDDGTPHQGGDALYGFEVAIGGDGEPRFDHVHAEPVELLGQAQLLLHIHAAARRLLAVTKRGVEDGNTRPIHEFRPSGKSDYSTTLSADSVKRKGYYLYRSSSINDSISNSY